MTISRTTRSGLAAALSAVALACGIVLPPSNAVAAPGGHHGATTIVCGGEQQVTYSPGISLWPGPQEIDVVTRYENCAGLGADPGLAGTSTVATTHPSRGCVEPLEVDEITVDIAWNTGRTSTFTATRTVTDLGATIAVTYTGSVTTGYLEGASLVQTIAYPSITAIQCLATPVTERTGISTAIFATPI